MNATGYFIEFSDTRLPIVIRRHASSRRLIVRYQPLQQSVSLTIPRYATIKQGLRFVEEKRDWLLRQVVQFSHAVTFADGKIIPVLGSNLRLAHVGGRGLVSLNDSELHVHGDPAFMARRVRDWLKSAARKEIARLAAEYADRIGVKHSAITLRDTSSRWGSCSPDGNLSFSWRLVFAPHEVLAYVVAHEVAHLREHNHSPAFWAVVAELCPQWQELRHWLKHHGAQLYNYG